MKLRAEQKALHAALAHAARVIPNRPVTPVLAGVLLEVVGDVLSASGFDYETSATSRLEVDGSTDARVLAPGSYLVDLLGRMPSGPVEMVSDDGRTLVISAGRAKATLPLLYIEDYPALPAIAKHVGDVDGADFSQALKHCGSAVDMGNGLDVLKGVRLEATDGVLQVVATDRYRVHNYQFPWTGQPFAATIPFAAIRSVNLDGVLGLHADESSVSFVTDNRTTTTRILADEYIRWQSIVPSPTDVVTIDRDALSEALKRASAVIADHAAVTLDFADGLLNIDSGAQDGPRVADLLEYNGDLQLTCAFQPSFLLDALAPIATRNVRIGFMSAKKPVLFTDDTPGDYRGIVQPVRLNG